MEQLIFLAIIALISFVNWLMQRSAELREKKKLERQRSGQSGESPYRPHPIQENHEVESAPSPAAPDPAADMRRLMEALGLPLEEEAPRTAPAPPPLPTFEEVPAALEAPRPIPTFVPPPRATPAAALATPIQRPAPPMLRTLQTRDGLRQAIVLREILGPPKALAN